MIKSRKALTHVKNGPKAVNMSQEAQKRSIPNQLANMSPWAYLGDFLGSNSPK